jgi:hypothetical protein
MGADRIYGPRGGEPACVVCGCVEGVACVGGCYWVMRHPPLCSACVAIGQKIAQAIKSYPVTAFAFVLANPEQKRIARRRRG